MSNRTITLHEVTGTVGTTSVVYHFYTTDLYAPSAIEGFTGIKKSTAPDIDRKFPTVAVKELMRVGILFRVGVEYKTTAGAYGRDHILCEKSKMAGLEAAVAGKSNLKIEGTVVTGTGKNRTSKVNTVDKGQITEVIPTRRASYT